MPDSTVLLVVVVAVVTFVLGTLYYGVLGRAVAVQGASAASPWMPVVEAGRCLVLAAVVVVLAGAAGVGTWTGGLLLGLVLWIGFPAVLRAGAMLHEKSPWRVAAVHAGDWLVKLLVLGAIAGLWR